MYAARGSAHLVVPVIALVALAVLVCGGSAVASSGAAPRTGHAVLAAANGTGRAATAKAARPGWLPDVAATVPAGNQPSGAAVDPQTNTVYVASYGTGVLVINGKTDAVIRTIPVRSPLAVAVDPFRDMIYVTSSEPDSLVAINGRTDAVTGSVLVGRIPGQVAVDSATNTIYVVNYLDSTLSVIDGRTDSVTATITVGATPTGVAVDQRTSTVYVASNATNELDVISGQTNTLTGIIPVGDGPYGVAVDDLTGTIYVTDSVDGNVLAINGNSYAVTAVIPINTFWLSAAVEVNPKLDEVYVANLDGGSVTVISGRTNRVVGKIAVGAVPRAVAVNDVTGETYVPSELANTLSVLSGPSLAG